MRCRLVLLLLLGLIPLGSGGAAAQDLRQGELSFEVLETGYGGFALPVANAALGRDWAAGTGYAWQVGRNYSTVPIRLRIEHRFPYALRGTLEVISAHGFAREEDPLGHLTVLSRELLVPPSVPLTVVLTPRVCPPSLPGEVTRLHLRFYMGTSQTPQWEDDVSAVQLEPAHVYSLYLDGPEGGITADPVNPAGRLALAWNALSTVWPPVMSFNHYVLSQERAQVTLAPLASRDWVFVVADLRQVATWTAEEQAALKLYMLGGGRLCLCGAGQSPAWQGLPLDAGPQPLGRGFLIPVAGGFEQARPVMTTWLEGELEEFTIFSGGTVGGEGLPTTALTDGFTTRDQLLAQYAPPVQPAEVVSHRASFLNPIVVYREMCVAGALEPWDYPEFSLDLPDATKYNANLREATRIAGGTPIKPLFALAHPPVHVPVTLFFACGLLPLLALGGGIRHKRSWVALAASVLGLAAALTLWWGVQPRTASILQLGVWDTDRRVAGAIRRELAAALAGRGQDLKLPVASQALIRHIGWRGPGDWLWRDDGETAAWEGSAGGNYATVASESPVPAGPPSPVDVVCRRLDPARVRIEINTERLPAGESAWLITPLGMQAIDGGQPRVVLELELPWIDASPGLKRLGAWDQCLIPQDQGAPVYSVTDRQLTFALRYAIAHYDQAGPATSLASLAQIGLLQHPGSRLTWLNSQGTLLVPLPHPNADTAEYLRLTFPLAGEATAP